jgi:hypothetical protein
MIHWWRGLQTPKIPDDFSQRRYDTLPIHPQAMDRFTYVDLDRALYTRGSTAALDIA